MKLQTGMLAFTISHALMINKLLRKKTRENILDQIMM